MGYSALVQKVRGMKRFGFFGAALFALVSLGTVPAAADSNTAAPITVFAAASLREAFEAAALAFTKRTGFPVVFNFGGSDMLATQIAQGAPASVFASANEKQMQKIVDGGFAGAAPEVFARNGLVAIANASGPPTVTNFADLARRGVTVVLAAPSVPVGAYARAALAKMNGRPGYAVDFAATVEKNVVSNELDVKAVVTKIALGEADAGIVYATDVTPAVAAKLRTIAIPPEAAVDATYPIVVLKAAPNVDAARAFVAFVQREGRRYLLDRGFRAP